MCSFKKAREVIETFNILIDKLIMIVVEFNERKNFFNRDSKHLKGVKELEDFIETVPLGRKKITQIKKLLEQAE